MTHRAWLSAAITAASGVNGNPNPLCRAERQIATQETRWSRIKHRMLAHPLAAAAYAVVKWLWTRRQPAQETNSAEYAYSVWFRHLIRTRRAGLNPLRVVELGPGASLGVGICALLTGSERYIALDVDRYASPGTNLPAFDGVVALLAIRAPIPSLPTLPAIDSSEFPDVYVDRDGLGADRVADLRSRVALDEIEYDVPWTESRIRPGTIDLVLSQSVMEHVADPATVYRSMAAWLRPGGISSHTIDFRSHDRAPLWNGHWAYPEFLWQFVAGRRSPINRFPLSSHLAAIRAAGLEVVAVERLEVQSSGLRRADLAPRWRDMPDTDLTCTSAFVQAVRPLPHGPVTRAQPTRGESGIPNR